MIMMTTTIPTVAALERACFALDLKEYTNFLEIRLTHLCFVTNLLLLFWRITHGARVKSHLNPNL
jgi:hypothetical protein